MEALLGLKNATSAFAVSGFFEPGYDRSCNWLPSYDAFIARMKQIVPAAGCKRPLETIYVLSSSSTTTMPIVFRPFLASGAT